MLHIRIPSAKLFSKIRKPLLGLLAVILLFGTAPDAFAAPGDVDADYASVTAIGRIARYSAVGALEAGYPTGSGFNGTVRALVRQADGKMIVGGDFTAYNGTARNRIARLNADGTLDGTFDPGTGFDEDVYDLVLDGTDVYVGGLFTSFNGTERNYIARLNTNGTLDALVGLGENRLSLNLCLFYHILTQVLNLQKILFELSH